MWLTLGRYPDVPLAEGARDRQRRAQDRRGRRHAARAEGRRAEAEKKTKTYAEVVELYFDAKLTTLRTGHASRT